MTYIVYIPDIARGEEAYTQRSFMSLKDLARWAMDAALEAPVPPAETIKHVMATQPVEAEKPAIIKMLEVSSGLSDINIVVPADLVTKEKDEEFTADTSAWFTEESAFSMALEARDWESCALITYRKLSDTAFTYTDGPTETLAEEDVRLFLNTAVNHLPTLIEDMIPEWAGVSWGALPHKFQNALMAQVIRDPYNPLGVPKRKAAHPVAKNFFQIINFFREGRRHLTWKTETVMFREMELYSAPTHQIALALIGNWWTGSKTTDEIHEFMVKLTVLRFFVNANKSATIGSSEFLDQFFKYIVKLDLPAEFVAWATKGTTHRHCRKALHELNIVQARRAEGQRFIGLEEFKEYPAEEAVLKCYAFNYNPLFDAVREKDLIAGDGGFPFSAWNSDGIQLLAAY